MVRPLTVLQLLSISRKKELSHTETRRHGVKNGGKTTNRGTAAGGRDLLHSDPEYQQLIADLGGRIRAKVSAGVDTQ